MEPSVLRNHLHAGTAVPTGIWRQLGSFGDVFPPQLRMSSASDHLGDKYDVQRGRMWPVISSRASARQVALPNATSFSDFF